MNRRFVVAAAFFGIAACATSSPEAPEPVANAGNPVTNSNPTAAEEQFEVVEVPEVPIAANMPAPVKVTCRRETEIGSRRVKRICRTRSEIDQTEAAAQDTLNDLQKMQDLQRTQIDY
ncbi:MAG: hypothetical protein ABFS45_21805 [Pseudomonadota bacterium]